MSRSIRFANLNAYKLGHSLIGGDSWNARVNTIREIAPDVLALQEVVVDETRPPSEWAVEASAVVQQLAAECGLSAATVRADGTPGPTAMASNVHRGWYTALLWNPETVEPAPGGFRPLGAPDFWHGYTTCAFDVGAAEPVIVGSYHGDPFRGDLRRTRPSASRASSVRPGAPSRACCSATSTLCLRRRSPARTASGTTTRSRISTTTTTTWSTSSSTGRSAASSWPIAGRPRSCCAAGSWWMPPLTWGCRGSRPSGTGRTGGGPGPVGPAPYRPGARHPARGARARRLHHAQQPGRQGCLGPSAGDLHDRPVQDQ